MVDHKGRANVLDSPRRREARSDNDTNVRAF